MPFIPPGMDEDRPHPAPADSPVLCLSPTRAELVRYFAWGYFSRRELNDRLRRDEPGRRRSRATSLLLPDVRLTFA